jgi:hypothetical protein
MAAGCPRRLRKFLSALKKAPDTAPGETAGASLSRGKGGQAVTRCQSELAASRCAGCERGQATRLPHQGTTEYTTAFAKAIT